MRASIFLLLLLNSTFLYSQLERSSEIVNRVAKRIHNRIKADGQLTHHAYVIHFSQNPVLRYCDSIVKVDSNRQAEYTELKKHLLGYKKLKDAQAKWIIEVAEKYDILIADVSQKTWAKEIYLEYFKDHSVQLIAVFEKEKKLIVRLEK